MHKNSPAVNALFGDSGGYESRLEHLNHVVRMETVQSKQFPPSFGVDFSQPLSHVTNEYLTIASGTRLQRAREEEEARILKENQSLIRRLGKYDTTETRLKHHALLAVPHDSDNFFAFQGSNIFHRQTEGDRITEANVALAQRLVSVKPSVNSKKIKKEVSRHDQLVQQISKFAKGKFVTTAVSPRALQEDRWRRQQRMQRSPNRSPAAGGEENLLAIEWSDEMMPPSPSERGTDVTGAPILPPPLYKCSPAEAKAVAIGRSAEQHAVSSRASPFSETVLFTQASQPYHTVTAEQEAERRRRAARQGDGVGSSSFLPKIPTPPSPRCGGFGGSMTSSLTTRVRGETTIVTPNRSPRPEGVGDSKEGDFFLAVAAGEGGASPPSPRDFKKQAFIAFQDGDDGANKTVIRGPEDQTRGAPQTARERTREKLHVHEKEPRTSSPRASSSGKRRGNSGRGSGSTNQQDTTKLPWQSPSVDDIRAHYYAVDASVRRASPTKKELSERHRIVTNQAFYRRGEGSITLLGLYKSNSERMAALSALSSGGARRGRTSPRNGGAGLGYFGGTVEGGVNNSSSPSSSPTARPRSFSVLNAQHRLEAHKKASPKKNHQSSSKRNVVRDAEEEYLYTSKSVYALHNDDDPEPPEMTFNTHDYGDSHVCVKGCFRSHHKQLNEWRQKAKAVNTQRERENEQFSIANQLAIQKQKKLEWDEMRGGRSGGGGMFFLSAIPIPPSPNKTVASQPTTTIPFLRMSGPSGPTNGMEQQQPLFNPRPPPQPQDGPRSY